MKIVQDNETCRLFIPTFEGIIIAWFRTLLAKSIHSWKQFMEMFIVAHENYVYDELVDEVVEIRRLRNEYENDFFRRVMHIYCRFPKSDEPLGQEIFDWFSYLISIYEECDLNDQAISYSQN
jgi:hypothetical protein